MTLSFVHEASYGRLPAVAAVVRYPVTGRPIEFTGLIDTAADGTLLDELFALRLGIDLDSAERIAIGGVVGGTGWARVATVEIAVVGQENLRATVEAAFAPGVTTGVGNLLGLDLWSAVDLGLSHSHRTAYFGAPQP